MKEIIRMMSEMKQPCLRKYLWLALLLFLVNVLWGSMEIFLRNGTNYLYITYQMPSIVPTAIRLTILLFLIFQLRDALQFMNKGSLQRVLLLPTKRYLYPITQMFFTFLCIVLLRSALCSSLLVGYAIFSMQYGFVENGLIYALIRLSIDYVFPFAWDQILYLFILMITCTVAVNAICLYLQAPIVILVQCVLIFLLGIVFINIGNYINNLHVISPYLIGAVCMTICDSVSIAYTLYIFQIGKASGGS